MVHGRDRTWRGMDRTTGDSVKIGSKDETNREWCRENNERLDNLPKKGHEKASAHGHCGCLAL